MYTVEMLPAFLGDSLWIEYGDPAAPSRLLIDGGLVGTVDEIERRIHAVAECQGRCELELLVVTHVDADHIEGIVKLLGSPSLPLDIRDVWFNGWEQLPEADGSNEDEFLGAKQGEFLSALLRERELPWNRAFAGRTIYVPDASKGKLPRTTLPGGMELTLLSPTRAQLLRLSKCWDEELRAAGLLEATHEEVLAELRRSRSLAPDEDFLGEGEIDVAALVALDPPSDGSPANGSSIAFVASYGGRSCLFAGDAYSPVLRDGARRLARELGGERLALDAFKLPHHGSKANLHDDLLAALDCRSFLVSTDGGRFRHPDDQAIARLVGGRWRASPGSDRPVEIHFNYRTPCNEAWDDPALQRQWNYRAIYPTEPGLRVVLAG